MQGHTFTALCAAVALLGLPLAGAAAQSADSQSTGSRPDTSQAASGQSPGKASVETIIGDWPKVSRKAADAMIKKYGEPDEATRSMLIWHDSGPWKRTIVYNEEIDHNFPMPHKDVLEQFIAYNVPSDKFDDLAEYDGSVIAERTKGELSARCDKEGANFLAINLANDIVNGDKNVQEARQAYADAIKASMDGNPPDTMKGFTFEVNRDYAGDPGETVIEGAATGAGGGSAGASDEKSE